MKRVLGIIQVIIICTITVIAVSPAAAIRVTMEDLGTMGGTYGTAFAINDGGQVVGETSTPEGKMLGFLWEKGAMSNPLPSSASGFSIMRINDNGQMIVSEDGGAFYLLEKETLTRLNGGDAVDINNSGQVLMMDQNTFPWTIIVWENGGATRKVVLPFGEIWATAMNDHGDIVGAGRFTSPFYIDHLTEKIVYPIGALAGAATDINNTGQIVGWTENEGKRKAFLWDPKAGLSYLGTLGGEESYAVAINDLGQIVGLSTLDVIDPTTERPIANAFLWTPETGMIDLGSLACAWKVLTVQFDIFSGCSSALDINNQGQIVGYSDIDANTSHPVLWSWEMTPPTPVEIIENLAQMVSDQIVDGALAESDGTPLLAKLTAATEKLNENNQSAACGILGAFVNQVAAKIRSGRMSKEDGDSLSRTVEAMQLCD